MKQCFDWKFTFLGMLFRFPILVEWCFPCLEIFHLFRIEWSWFCETENKLRLGRRSIRSRPIPSGDIQPSEPETQSVNCLNASPSFQIFQQMSTKDRYFSENTNDELSSFLRKSLMFLPETDGLICFNNFLLHFPDITWFWLWLGKIKGNCRSVLELSTTQTFNFLHRNTVLGVKRINGGSFLKCHPFICWYSVTMWHIYLKDGNFYWRLKTSRLCVGINI